MSAPADATQRALAVALERARIAEARVDELRARAERFAATASLGVLLLQQVADTVPPGPVRDALLHMARNMREGITS